MRNKKLLIVTVVLLNLLNFRLKNGIARSMIYKIYLKHGILLSLKRIRVDRKLNILVDRIYFKKKSRLRISVKSFSIRLSFSPIIRRINCEFADILFESPRKANNNKASVANGQSAIIQRLFRRLQGNTLSRMASLAESINVADLQVRHPGIRAEMAVSNFEFAIKKNKPDQFLINTRLVDLGINLSLLSTEPVNVNQIDVNAEINVHKDKIEISRSSTFSLNNIPLLVEFSYDFLKKDAVKFSFIIIIKGNSFFKSYPFFYTEDLNKIEATGDLILQVIYVHNLQNIAASYFRAKVIKDDLKIQNFNTSALCKLAGDFSYTAVKNGKVLREIQLCDCNQGFLKIERIPKKLSDLVVMTEDPKFYEHNGIDAYNIQQAILTNFELRKFSRGASTITMQLVRNLFLGHHKNISRKLEEFIIAWLLEKHASIKKERILEIYLNIIEFGNNVYGIAEASKYYFGKPVNELSLTEQLVLCYIIPRPDFFLDALLSQSEQLKENLKNHISLHTQKLSEQTGIPGTIFFKPEFGSLCLD